MTNAKTFHLYLFFSWELTTNNKPINSITADTDGYG